MDEPQDIGVRHQFTPAPWSVGNDGYNISRVYSANGESVAEVYGVPMHTSADEIPNLGSQWVVGLANARLIAAAPRMYGELEAAAGIFRAYEAVHLEKGTAEGDQKAKRNAAFAETIEKMLAEIRYETPNTEADHG